MKLINPALLSLPNVVAVGAIGIFWACMIVMLMPSPVTANNGE